MTSGPTSRSRVRAHVDSRRTDAYLAGMSTPLIDPNDLTVEDLLLLLEERLAPGEAAQLQVGYSTVTVAKKEDSSVHIASRIFDIWKP